MNNGQFMACVMDEITRETVRLVAAQLDWHNLKISDGGVDTALGSINPLALPAFLLVDISDSDDPIAALDALCVRCGGATKIVAIGLLNDVGLYRRLIELGVSDYLVKPVSGKMLGDAIKAASTAGLREPEAAKSARTIAVIGARGGVGATTLAVSAAWSMAQDQGLRVVLLDLDLHFGSLALSLDIEPGRGLREILTNPDRIDSLLINSTINHATERLSILVAEEPLEDHIEVGHEGLDALLADLRGEADCIVVDIPRSLTALSRHMLGLADVIAIVTDLSLPALRDTQRLLHLIKMLHRDAKVTVIANRIGGIAGEVGRADFERGIGAKIDFAVPVDNKAATAAAERAKPLVTVSRNAATVSEINNFAQSLTGQVPAPKPSLVKRIIGK